MVNKTVCLDAIDFPVYADLDDAQKYMTGNYNNSSWFDPITDNDTRKRLLITATRILDRQRWRGSPSGLSGQTLAWPRTGTGVPGVTDTEVPKEIEYACIELANLILNGSDVEENPQPGVQTINSFKAGSVAITYFRDAENVFLKRARFPTVVQELIGKFLEGTGVHVTGVATGTDGESVTREDFGFNEGL